MQKDETQGDLRPVEQVLIFLLKSGSHLRAIKDHISAFFVGDNPKGRLCVQNKDDENKSLLHYALNNYQEDIIELLLQILPSEAYELINTDEKTPLMIAIERCLPVATQLLTKSAVRLQHVKGKSVLAVACEGGNEVVVKSLFKLFSHKELINWPHFCDNDGNSPLYYAMINDHDTMVRLLVEQYNIPIDTINNANESLLLLCAKKNKIDTALYLLSRGAPINHEDDNGYTALHWACDRQHDKLVKALLEHGANAFIHERSNWMPLSIAAKREDPILLDHLYEHGAGIGAHLSYSDTSNLLRNNSYFMLAADIPLHLLFAFRNCAKDLSDIVKKSYTPAQLNAFTIASLNCLVTNKNLSKKQKISIQEFLDYQLRNQSLKGRVIQFLSGKENCKTLLKYRFTLDEYNRLPKDVQLFLPELKKQMDELKNQAISSNSYKEINQSYPVSHVDEIMLEANTFELKVLATEENDEETEPVETPGIYKLPVQIVDQPNDSVHEMSNLDKRAQYILNINQLVEELTKVNQQFKKYNSIRLVWKLALFGLFISLVLSYVSFKIRMGLKSAYALVNQEQVAEFIRSHAEKLVKPNDTQQYSRFILWSRTLLALMYDVYKYNFYGQNSDYFIIYDDRCGYDYLYNTICTTTTTGEQLCIKQWRLADCLIPYKIVTEFFSFVDQNKTAINWISIPFMAIAVLLAGFIIMSMIFSYWVNRPCTPKHSIRPLLKIDENDKKMIESFKAYLAFVTATQNEKPEIATHQENWRDLQNSFEEAETTNDIVTSLKQLSDLLIKEKEVVNRCAQTGQIMPYYENPYIFFANNTQQKESKYLEERNTFLLEQIIVTSP